MKKLYITLGLFIASLVSAQVPQAFSYQTIAFNSAGAPIANGNVSLKISILENSATGNVLYTETHTKTTNAKGLINLNIGQGTSTAGSFGGINWGANTKFVKVEMDPQGGSNYTNVGVNQLLSVPYAQVSKTVVTGAGQGITLTSPNGTSYTLGVSDSGTLSLPTATASNSTLPGDLYFYSSNTAYNASTAELLRNLSFNSFKIGYKYLPANTQLKLIAAPNSSAQAYGVDANGNLVPNGNAVNVTSNGFYRIYTTVYNYPNTSFFTENISPMMIFNSSPLVTSATTYNTATNKFSININGATSSNFSGFKINIPATVYSYSISEILGDNLSDGTFDINGSFIMLPNLSATPKNFKIEFTVNFDATGTYTITQI